jgi:hypothetical protein
MGKLQRLFVVVALACAAPFAWPIGVGAEPGQCLSLVHEAQGWLASPERYMEAPRPGDPGREEPPLVYAEIDHYELAENESSAEGIVLEQKMVPVYRAFSLGGVVQRVATTTRPDGKRADVFPAVDAIVGAWDAWAQGDPSKPVPYDVARSILIDAEGRCNTA